MLLLVQLHHISIETNKKDTDLATSGFLTFTKNVTAKTKDRPMGKRSAFVLILFLEFEILQRDLNARQPHQKIQK